MMLFVSTVCISSPAKATVETLGHSVHDPSHGRPSRLVSPRVRRRETPRLISPMRTVRRDRHLNLLTAPRHMFHWFGGFLQCHLTPTDVSGIRIVSDYPAY